MQLVKGIWEFVVSLKSYYFSDIKLAACLLAANLVGLFDKLIEWIYYINEFFMH